MNELQLVIAIIAITVLLIIVLILSIVREITSKKTPLKSETVPQEPENQSAPNELTAKLPSNPEPTKEHELETEPDPQQELVSGSEEMPALRMAEHDIEMVEEPQTNESDYQAPPGCNQNLPQDSMLRRHYLTHLRAMIEALNTPCPTEPALRRHYDSIIAAELEQCLNDQGAVEQLISRYQDHKNTSAQTIQDKSVKAESLAQGQSILHEEVIRQDLLKLPEDSMLRRHFLTNIQAMVEANMSPRPTDSALSRHYDAMVNAEIKRRLG